MKQSAKSNLKTDFAFTLEGYVSVRVRVCVCVNDVCLCESVCVNKRERERQVEDVENWE